MPPAEPDDTAKRILKAAGERFLHYGYGKTTMSEIAGDCNMSTGNLYRFFPSKLDIAEAFVRGLREDQLRKLRAAAALGKTPQERLRALLNTKFNLAYDRWHGHPKAYELTSEILSERPEFADEWEAAEGELLADLLAEGAREGVFRAGDSLRLARLVQNAVFRFTSPAIFHEGERSALARELDELVSLLLDALSLRTE